MWRCGNVAVEEELSQETRTAPRRTFQHNRRLQNLYMPGNDSAIFCFFCVYVLGVGDRKHNSKQKTGDKLNRGRGEQHASAALVAPQHSSTTGKPEADGWRMGGAAGGQGS